MAYSYVNFDFSDMKAFFNRVRQAGGGDFKKALELFLEGLGMDFLRIVQDEIIRRDVVDTSLLLQSFQKGDKGSVWVMREGDLTLEIGSNVKYAKFVNDGHWTNKKGQAGRFVPGAWEGGKFTYDSGAKTGMYLKQKWVPGKPYWDSAVRAIEKIAPKALEAKLQEWLSSYFKDYI